MNSFIPDILRGVTTGAIDQDEGMALFGLAGAGMPLLKPVSTKEESALGMSAITLTQDATGKTLVAGRRYILDGTTVVVLREEHGGGNFLDTWTRVYYLGPDMTEEMFFVEVAYPEGIMGGPLYRSRFEPAPVK